MVLLPKFKTAEAWLILNVLDIITLLDRLTVCADEIVKFAVFVLSFPKSTKVKLLAFVLFVVLNVIDGNLVPFILPVPEQVKYPVDAMLIPAAFGKRTPEVIDNSPFTI